ncbi:MAG: aminopeptidase family protein P, partial [Evtepia sp.]
DKIADIRSHLKENDILLISALDEIAWLLNIRGNDIVPVVLSYLVVTSECVLLFANSSVFSSELKTKLMQDGVFIRAYDEIYTYLRSLSEKRVLLDSKQINAQLFDSISVEISEMVSPILRKKCIKNETEIKNMTLAHLRDGLAVTHFLYWLHENIGKIKITECSAAEKLEEFRHQQPGYLGASFPPIIAYAEHGAIVHYTATEATDYELEPNNFLLMDTGGHYLQGTTDCTRTVSLGRPTAEQKKHYTAVLRGLLNLADAQFLHGTSGISLDYVARAPLLAMGLNYAHSTGHGVGYLLNVHENPNHFSGVGASFEKGMITSDEPGVYLTGRYGIRLENLILCVSRMENEYGEFMGFEHLTCVPFDLDSIDLSAMSPHEIFLLRRYQEFVFEKLAPYLEDEMELRWLSRCRLISPS